MDQQHEILTLEEVADYLRVSERTVYDWAQKAEIPCGKLGTSWRFRRSDIERWVEEKLGRKAGLEAVPIVLRDILPVDRVLVLDAATKREALDALIDRLAAAPQVRNREDLAREVYRRERLMSTGIGRGIAVPHVRLTSVEDIVMAAGVSKRDIVDYESLDGRPVRIILMVAANRDQHAEYLKTLASLCALLREDSFREQILSSQDPAQVHALLTQDR